jgi:hypothetical protein
MQKLPIMKPCPRMMVEHGPKVPNASTCSVKAISYNDVRRGNRDFWPMLTVAQGLNNKKLPYNIKQHKRSKYAPTHSGVLQPPPKRNAPRPYGVSLHILDWSVSPIGEIVSDVTQSRSSLSSLTSTIIDRAGFIGA